MESDIEKANLQDLDLSGPVDLVVLSIKKNAARCRLLENDQIVTFRSGRLWNIVPGEIITIHPMRSWNYAGHPYLSGEIKSTRLDIAALNIVPLRLENRDMWAPQEQYWGETEDPIDEYIKPIIARGTRPQFEMEQVLPGADPENPFSDPITESNDLKDSQDGWGARKILMNLCQLDLRCLDAHAHLGNLVFDCCPQEAIRHYEMGVRIGELSLGDGFDGVLPWGMIDNRPFLRCMQGLGLCLWRLGRFQEAGRAFEKMLWLNPRDNQGVRFLLPSVQVGEKWENRN